MACPDENTLYDFAAGAAGAELRARIDRHLDACNDCRQLVAALVRGRRADAGEDSTESATTPRVWREGRRLPSETLFERGAMVGDRYRLDAFVAFGGMSEVWRAVDTVLDVPVIVKFMGPTMVESAELRSRFEREAKAAARLRGHHVVAVFGHGLHHGVPYIVMELLEGEDLDRRLERRGRLSLSETAALAQQIGRGIQRAHDARIVHRDLKPSNVFLAIVDGVETAKLLDFGLAKAPSTASAGTLTRTGQVMGTLQYMSPEQAIGDSFIDHRSDLWSFGVILFRALTGRDAIEADNIPSAIACIVSGTIPRATDLAPDLPPAVDAFFQRAFALQRDARFASALEMVETFGALAEPVTAPPAEPGPSTASDVTPPPRRRARGPLIALLAVVSLAVGAASGLAWLLPQSEATTGAPTETPEPTAGPAAQPPAEPTAPSAAPSISAPSISPPPPETTPSRSRTAVPRRPPPPRAPSADPVWGWE